jgi:cob(I)alamin adenosyltransferase
MLGQGRVIVHTGDGKGKTTAAFGAVLRAAGHGLKIAVVQFIKGTWDYGEVKALAAFRNVELTRIGSGFTWKAEDPDEPRALAEEAWELSRNLALSDRYDLLVLDELNCAVAEGYISVQDVLELLRKRPTRLSVIITGRSATLELMEFADTVTEMRCVKHAFDRGVPARRGIEY